jgi:hypothetical protein
LVVIKSVSRGIFPSLDFYNGTALLTPITDFPFVRRLNLIKFITPLAVNLKALWAIPSTQLVCVDGKMTVPTPQHILLFRQLYKVEMAA